jgi:hypothetical protein
MMFTLSLEVLIHWCLQFAEKKAQTLSLDVDVESRSTQVNTD